MDHFLCFLLTILCYLPLQFLVEAKIGGFTVNLVHRDSQLSPFYNNSATPGDLSRKDALRSIARARNFRPTSMDRSKIVSTITPNEGDYLMKISIGSPPVEFLATADTGSDLIWLQCEPCGSTCYHQDRAPFNPKQSSTYVELSCNSKPCHDLPQSSCGATNNECKYMYTYGDDSYTSGEMATDTFTFDSANDGQVAAFPNFAFGCGHDNGGTFTSRDAGLVGLGGGPLSLISQLGTQIEQRFSYCLLPRTVNSASKLKFGTDAILSGSGVVSTPLLSGSTSTFYYLTLEAVSVGDKRIPYNTNQLDTGNSGNIIIDSGTTLTILESEFYSNLEAVVKEAIGLESIQDPQPYNLCYDNGVFSSSSVSDMTMVFHFTGADVTLKALNLFQTLDSATCLAIVPADGMTVYGNWAQMNFQVEYDLAKKQLSFAPADCTQY